MLYVDLLELLLSVLLGSVSEPEVMQDVVELHHTDPALLVLIVELEGIDQVSYDIAGQFIEVLVEDGLWSTFDVDQIVGSGLRLLHFK